MWPLFTLITLNGPVSPYSHILRLAIRASRSAFGGDTTQPITLHSASAVTGSPDAWNGPLEGHPKLSTAGSHHPCLLSVHLWPSPSPNNSEEKERLLDVNLLDWIIPLLKIFYCPHPNFLMWHSSSPITQLLLVFSPHVLLPYFLYMLWEHWSSDPAMKILSFPEGGCLGSSVLSGVYNIVIWQLFVGKPPLSLSAVLLVLQTLCKYHLITSPPLTPLPPIEVMPTLGFLTAISPLSIQHWSHCVFSPLCLPTFTPGRIPTKQSFLRAQIVEFVSYSSLSPQSVSKKEEREREVKGGKERKKTKTVWFPMITTHIRLTHHFWVMKILSSVYSLAKHTFFMQLQGKSHRIVATAGGSGPCFM